MIKGFWGDDGGPKTRQAFVNHYDHVGRVLSEKKLLEFSVPYEWERLCKFLGVPVPEGDFPFVNDSADFQESFRAASWVVLCNLCPVRRRAEFRGNSRNFNAQSWNTAPVARPLAATTPVPKADWTNFSDAIRRNDARRTAEWREKCEKGGFDTYKPMIKETYKKTDAEQADFGPRKILKAMNVVYAAEGGNIAERQA
ncbi:hypothetical protein K432DRAFT_455465 [Lepidopterella palustris CBS 459.81]|uniref:Uncharacterized protein n=1 Tax=Lepidopterella palustris CBS 459.81 TaxID=1314670 RepID=A0A8E2E8V5_9PEZI|nr:hypothetical protein K432DRAFT_455465 [Lepidopterella palustris CBS 459.81]